MQQQQKKPVSEPAEINLCVKYCMYWDGVTSSARTLSLVTESSHSLPAERDPKVFPLGLTEIDTHVTTLWWQGQFPSVAVQAGPSRTTEYKSVAVYSLSDMVVFLHIYAFFLPTDWVWKAFKILSISQRFQQISDRPAQWWMAAQWKPALAGLRICHTINLCIQSRSEPSIKEVDSLLPEYAGKSWSKQQPP